MLPTNEEEYNMYIEIFREDNWDRWMDDLYMQSDTHRLDRIKDRCLLEYLAIYGNSQVARWAMRGLGVSEVPDSVAGIKSDDYYSWKEQRWAVLQEQVMRETDYWALEKAVYFAPDEIARFAFARLTGCAWRDSGDPVGKGGIRCGLKQGVSREDIEQLCREMIAKDGRFSGIAHKWLEELPDISDEALAVLAAPKTERSWDRDPNEKLKNNFGLVREEDLYRDGQKGSGFSGDVQNVSDFFAGRIRDIYDTFILYLYTEVRRGIGRLLMDITLGAFGRYLFTWLEKYELDLKKALPETTAEAVRLVLTTCEIPHDDLTDEMIREIAYTETDNKRGHSYCIGLDLLYGFDTEGDGAEAVGPLTDAAEAGNKYAIEEIIDIYEEGIGVTKNPWLAKKWRKKYEEM